SSIAAGISCASGGRCAARAPIPTTRTCATPRRSSGISSRTAAPPAIEFRRDRLTWIAYALLAWFAYLQAAPGLVVAHLRDELDLSYSAGGLHVAAFAAGSVVAGVIAA